MMLMFDELIRTIKELDGTKLSISGAVNADEDGYIDRECAGPECKFTFKIHQDDWRDKVRDEEVFCPFCGRTDNSNAWFTEEQVKYAKRAALAQFKHKIGDAMRCDADNWNRRLQRSSFLKITMQVKGAHREVLIPATATEPMRLKIGCPSCQCRYSVIGSAFFCPACGHNSAEHVFHQSLETIRTTLSAIPEIRASIEDKDVAENTVRVLIENSLQNAVTAFQRYAEALFSHHPAPPKARRNVFQNLTEGNLLWQEAYWRNYGDHLDQAELERLQRYFQQRHVLTHREGLVDQEYVDRSGDRTYQPGQRLVIQKVSVGDCVALIEKLGTGMCEDAKVRFTI